MNNAFVKHVVVIAWAIAGATHFANAQYTFAPQVQSTNTASITYNSGTGYFQYTDAANPSDDFAGLILTGNAANLITTSNGWTASLTVNLSARSMPGNGSAVNVAMGLYVLINGNDSDSVKISLDQENNSGSGDYNNFYGTAVVFEAVTNSQNLETTPLGASKSFDGLSDQVFSGSVDASAVTESIDAASGVLSLTNDATTDTLTGYFNGAPVGSISLTSWGPKPSLSLAVVGFSDNGIVVLSETDTAGNFFAGSSLGVTTPSNLKDTIEVAYHHTLEASGGQPPYFWTNTSGTWPPGLTLATNGQISGTPTTNGVYPLTVMVTDALSSKATKGLTFSVGFPPGVALQPTNTTVVVALGNNVSLGVSVSGTGPFTYQWQQNGTNVPGVGIITTVAGNGKADYSGDGGAATNAELYTPSGVAIDAAGNLFIADTMNQRVREVGTNGIITTVAGNGFGAGALYGAYSGDGGAATNAELNDPGNVSLDAAGNLFIADNPNNRVRKVGIDGIITTVAGNGTGGDSGDGGAATNAAVSLVNASSDAAGNLYISDYGDERVRKVGTNGIITKVAGNGTYIYAGDGGPATNSEVEPAAAMVDVAGNLFIADVYNQRIRKVDGNGIITTVAGNGTKAFFGDGGPATDAELDHPIGLMVDAAGNLFIADAGNQRIRKVDTNGIITTVAGNGYSGGAGYGGYSGDGGLATNAELNGPATVAVDAAGDLFIADSGNERIRKVTFPGQTLELIDVSAGSAGAYEVVVSSPFGSVTSSVINVNVSLPATIDLSGAQTASGDTKFTFLVSGSAGSSYVLQISTNLLNWSSVTTSTIPVTGSIALTNSISGYNRSFYRAYLQ